MKLLIFHCLFFFNLTNMVIAQTTATKDTLKIFSETDENYIAQKMSFNRINKEKKLSFERVKNSGTYDLENQFSKSRLLLHQDLYKEFIAICEKEIVLLEKSNVLLQNNDYVAKLNLCKSELNYYKIESVKTNDFKPYKDPNEVADVNPYKVNDGFRYEQIFAQIEQEKTDIAFFKADFKKKIIQCSSKMCWECKGSGKVKEKSGTETIYGSNDVWTPQTKTVNTSTGHVETSYDFNKVSTTTQVDKYIDVDCKKCAGSGKCASSGCIEYEKYKVAINKYFPELCIE
jgi:hypothetical protein